MWKLTKYSITCSRETSSPRFLPFKVAASNALVASAMFLSSKVDPLLDPLVWLIM